MKKQLMILLAATLPLGACAGGYAVGGGVGYDGYYDDYYGPIYDGYWGDGDTFYYRAHRGGRWMADRDHHFRHDMGGPGYHHMQGRGHPPHNWRHGDHDGDHHH